MNLETELRATLDRLADEVKPAGLADGARRLAERRRARRVGFVAAAVVVTVFVVVVPMIEFVRPDARPAPVETPPIGAPSVPPRTPSPSPAVFGLGPIELPGGWMLGAAPGEEGGFWVWDRYRRAYRQVRYQHVYPAPTGDYAVVVATGGQRTGVLDLRRDTVRWLDRLVLWNAPEWTADGTRFLTRGQTGALNVLVVTARTGAVREVPSTGAGSSPEPPEALWMSGDRDIAVPGDDAGVWEVRSATTGELVREVTGLPGLAARTDFSPDGRWVVATRGGLEVLRDAATGEVGAELPYVYPGRAYWVDDERLLLLRGQDKRVIMVDRGGREVGSYPLPAAMGVDEEHNYSLIRM